MAGTGRTAARLEGADWVLTGSLPGLLTENPDPDPDTKTLCEEMVSCPWPAFYFTWRTFTVQPENRKQGFTGTNIYCRWLAPVGGIFYQNQRIANKVTNLFKPSLKTKRGKSRWKQTLQRLTHPVCRKKEEEKNRNNEFKFSIQFLSFQPNFQTFMF